MQKNSTDRRAVDGDESAGEVIGYCFLNRHRLCDASCMAYIPGDAADRDRQQACLLLSSVADVASELGGGWALTDLPAPPEISG